MIFHRYSEYEEPERPPFTLDDVIRTITELMMRHHVSFNDALRHMLENGMPLNEFLRNDGLDKILDDFIEQVEQLKQKIREGFDFSGFMDGQRNEYDDAVSDAMELAKDNPELTEKLQEAADGQNVSDFYQLVWDARLSSDADSARELADAIEKAKLNLENLHESRQFFDREGKDFTGDEKLDARAARNVRDRFGALEKLQEELIDAKDRGNLFGIDEEELEELLGEKAYEEFRDARDELLESLAQAMEQTGKVEEGDGMFKLTPAGARKVGHTTLEEIYATLKTDGTGSHHIGEPGEGSVEKVTTSRFEYGDSIAHLDIPSSLVNAMIRGGGALPIQMKMEDMEVHDTRGVARSSIVVMMDMSGSMSRFGRFYNAKKMALALDALTRAHYPEDSVSFIGFATLARKINLSEIIELGPEPITFMGGAVNMKVDLNKVGDVSMALAHVPRYFTNIQKGLEMSRRILSAEPSNNKEIILITDGAPTAYHEDGNLHLCYPPEEKAYAATLRETRACADDGVTINTFLLGSDFDTGYYGEGQFIERMMKISGGRLFHPEPDSLTKYVLRDYVSGKRKLIDF